MTATGQGAGSRGYGPWGEATYVPYSMSTPLQYRGQEGSYTDSETGLIYMLNRYYAPSLGRFISRDPIGFDGGINLYAYGFGDPVNYSDPEGLDGISDWIHGALDLGGMVPAFGAIPDLANAGLHWLEGNKGAATASLGAAIPILGDSAKGTWMAYRAYKASRNTTKVARAASKPIKAADELAEAGLCGKLWNKSTQFRGNKVYQRDDLIDVNRKDALGLTNLDRMKQGLAPFGPDGKPINLHHMLQTADGPIAEMTTTFHTANRRTIHINSSSIPSGVDRIAFNNWRKLYWKNRARGFR